MRFVSGEDIDRHLDFPSLIEALAGAFAAGFVAPARHHHGFGKAAHLLMPAWTGDAPGSGAWLGTKIVNVFPDNARLGLPAVFGVYVLQSGETGAPLAILDGTRLTHVRTAAASALAARFLARTDASHLLLVGAGALAPCLLRAHASVRPIQRVTIWNHRRETADALAGRLRAAGWNVAVSGDLQQAVGEADIISCATLSQRPLIAGAWLQPGVHLDLVGAFVGSEGTLGIVTEAVIGLIPLPERVETLVGAFSMAMRECDDAALLRARIYIDTPAAMTEGGDVAQALASGAIQSSDIVADLAALCRGKAAGRTAPGEITLFKSVGSAIEDLAAAILVWQRLQS